jgi:hypothetical protein
LLHLLQAPIAASLVLAAYLINPSSWPAPVASVFVSPLIIGVSQIAYMVPTAIYEFVEGRPELGKGIIIVASGTFLLNAACWGYVLQGLGQRGPRV